MATTYRGTAIFAGEIGNRCKLIVTNVDPDPAEFDTFAESVQTNYSDATLLLSGHTADNVRNATLPTNGSNSDRRAICYFKNTVTNTTVRLTIPSPKSSIIVEEQGGERVTAAALTLIAADLATLTGDSYTPIQGYVIQKK